MHQILKAKEVKNAKPGDRLSDGDGLRLDLDKNGKASWIFRFKSPKTSKERLMGLGPLRDVSLAQAREGASAARALVRNNKDPIEHRKEDRAKAKAEAAGTITFEAYAKRYISGKETAWKNEKHRQQWSNSLGDYAYPTIGHIAVPALDTELVLRVLSPIWNIKKETARRVRETALAA
ncbi:tyrosine-type recombinase/integrase [Bradyrhizobium sp. DASA03120]|uniref:tyrosine-type recombinase/integrase n=2 Tax=unclassified Bradyrhizobium TaxID=2631580 RepID=UPI003F7168A8